MNSRTVVHTSGDRSERLHRNMITLENVIINDKTTCGQYALEITGKVRVANLCYEKFVFARVTFDDWSSYEDYNGIYAESSADNKTDVFSFHFMRQVARSVDVEFAVSCVQQGLHMWDNNDGKNYRFHLSKQPFNECKKIAKATDERYKQSDEKKVIGDVRANVGEEVVAKQGYIQEHGHPNIFDEEWPMHKTKAVQEEHVTKEDEAAVFTASTYPQFTAHPLTHTKTRVHSRVTKTEKKQETEKGLESENGFASLATEQIVVPVASKKENTGHDFNSDFTESPSHGAKLDVSGTGNSVAKKENSQSSLAVEGIEITVVESESLPDIVTHGGSRLVAAPPKDQVYEEAIVPTDNKRLVDGRSHEEILDIMYNPDGENLHSSKQENVGKKSHLSNVHLVRERGVVSDTETKNSDELESMDIELQLIEEPGDPARKEKAMDAQYSLDDGTFVGESKVGEKQQNVYEQDESNKNTLHIRNEKNITEKSPNEDVNNDFPTAATERHDITGAIQNDEVSTPQFSPCDSEKPRTKLSVDPTDMKQISKPDSVEKQDTSSFSGEEDELEHCKEQRTGGALKQGDKIERNECYEPDISKESNQEANVVRNKSGLENGADHKRVRDNSNSSPDDGSPKDEESHPGNQMEQKLHGESDDDSSEKRKGTCGRFFSRLCSGKKRRRKS